MKIFEFIPQNIIFQVKIKTIDSGTLGLIEKKIDGQT